MTTIVCPNCGAVIDAPKDEFTTLRVSKDFVTRLKNEQTDPTYEATLRRLLHWDEEGEV